MSAESRVGLGILVLAALLVTLLVDTFPVKYRGAALVLVSLAFSGILVASIW